MSHLSVSQQIGDLGRLESAKGERSRPNISTTRLAKTLKRDGRLKSVVENQTSICFPPVVLYPRFVDGVQPEVPF
jgi:hypothetical protein